MKIVKHSLVGNTVAICPYCCKALDKMPSRKTKCINCNKYYFARTRPSDRKKVVLSEEEAKIIEEQWIVQRKVDDFNREYLEVKHDFDEVQKFLKAQYGRDPRDNDVFWGTYNILLTKYAETFNWGLYRNIRLKMAQLLKRENKLEQALDTFLEICYLDINGPRNCGKIDWEIFKQFPPFDSKLGISAPGIIRIIIELMNEIKLSLPNVEIHFIQISEKILTALKILPIAPQEAWEKLKLEIEKIHN